MTGILVRYLALTQQPSRFAQPAVMDAVIRPEQLDLESYLSLYRSMGEPHRWDQRLRMPRDVLDRHLADPFCDLFVLRSRSDGSASGLCEFDSRNLPSVELVNIGLVPSAQGRGLGSFFLQEALVALWERRRPTLLWLHTDEWDGPSAMKVYRRAGFIVEREVYQDATDL